MNLSPDTTVFFTGAGISVGAGLPTYRGEGGLYTSGTLPPLRKSDTTAENLWKLWAHFDPLIDAIEKAEPTLAHRSISSWASERTVTITQNIDGLHARAGGEGQLIELHGRGGLVRCTGFNHVSVLREIERDKDNVPRCPTCGGRTRPDVVLFGERLNTRSFKAAKKAIRAAQAVISVGTSAYVVPAADLLDECRGLRYWVNPDEPPDRRWEWLRGDAQELLPGLLTQS